MVLFLKAINPMYMSTLSNGPYTPAHLIPSVTGEDGVVVPAKSVPKKQEEYTSGDFELIALDNSLQLIIVESMDTTMSQQIISCVSGKQMWDTIQLIMEGTEEVKENRLDILTSQYEAFKSNPGESISNVFERFNKILNELSIQGKTYPLRETNRKFMLTLPHQVEHKASSIRE